MSVQSLIQVNIESMLVILCISIWILTKVWTRDYKQKIRYIWTLDLLTVGMLVSDILAIIYRGNESVEGYYIVRAANYFNFMFLYAMSLFMCYFLNYIFEKPTIGRRRILASKVISIGTMVVLLLNLFIPFMYDFDEHNRYFRKNGWYINTVGQVLVIILLATIVIQLRNEIESSVFWMVLTEILMPLIASVVQLFIYGFSITNIAVGVTQILLFMILFRYQEVKIKERDIQIGEYNAKLILTQVQPHFMLNTLTTIKYLCKHDSEVAAETITDLSVYLRNNMEFAQTKEMITFEKELAHIEKYVSIEQKRFGDRVKIKYDLREKDFCLPPLSIQPLVENAIKHGISKKREGGTVELSTWRGVDKIHIIVKDDGIGFDVDQPFSSDRVHLGLEIVEERIKRMCNGEVDITSEVGNGTICEITIPIEFK